MGFAFFTSSTAGWTFGPAPPTEKEIPKEFYERTGYVPFNKLIAGSDTPAIDSQTASRNADFDRWLKRVKAALAAVGLSLEYKLYAGAGYWYTTTSMAEISLGGLQVFLNQNHYDIWTPGQAAEQLRRDAKKIV